MYYLFHIAPTKYSLFICLHGPKFVSFPVCACVFMCRLCFAWGSAMSGPAYRRESLQPNNEEFYGGDSVGSRYAVELSSNHLINCFLSHTYTNTCTFTHTYRIGKFIVHWQSHRQMSPSSNNLQGKNTMCAHTQLTSELQIVQTKQNVRTKSTHV